MQETKYYTVLDENKLSAILDKPIKKGTYLFNFNGDKKIFTLTDLKTNENFTKLDEGYFTSNMGFQHKYKIGDKVNYTNFKDIFVIINIEEILFNRNTYLNGIRYTIKNSQGFSYYSSSHELSLVNPDIDVIVNNELVSYKNSGDSLILDKELDSNYEIEITPELKEKVKKQISYLDDVITYIPYMLITTHINGIPIDEYYNNECKINLKNNADYIKLEVLICKSVFNEGDEVRIIKDYFVTDNKEKINLRGFIGEITNIKSGLILDGTSSLNTLLIQGREFLDIPDSFLELVKSKTMDSIRKNLLNKYIQEYEDIDSVILPDYKPQPTLISENKM